MELLDALPDNQLNENPAKAVVPTPAPVILMKSRLFVAI
jgi:hypothetical protein